jgi:DNA ligase 1
VRRFIELLSDLDQTNSSSIKIEKINIYFSQVSEKDGAWALYLLSGEKIPLKINRTFIQETFCEFMGLPLWLFKECYYHVGDSSETIALLRGPVVTPKDPPGLADFIEGELLVLKNKSLEEKRVVLLNWWRNYDEPSIFLIHKCLTGGLRVGVSKNILTQALAQLAQVDKEEMSSRLIALGPPSVEGHRNLLAPMSAEDNLARPYPFLLASPVDDVEEKFKSWKDWCVEWKWDGIRAQLIKRQGEIFLWSRGEELINQSFPEIIHHAKNLPDGTVIDGELLAIKEDQILPFHDLQLRLNRKKVTAKQLQTAPTTFMMFDILEWAGEDLRTRSLRFRKEILKEVGVFDCSEILNVEGIQEADKLRQDSRKRSVEGLMLKNWESTYQSGRRVGHWWKWKIDPLTIDCVLIYAQAGSGRRAGLYTDYTLAVWSGSDLIPITKAYSGLSDDELEQVDKWIKKNTIEKFGPVRSVRPFHVFEIAFEGIQESKRHKAGLALRFPRILRWRKDKNAEQADTLEHIKNFL